MKFSNIGITDDSISGVFIINSIKNKFHGSYIMISDNKNFPYSIRYWKVKDMVKDLQEKIDRRFVKTLVVPNPVLAVNINKEMKYEIVDGLSESFRLLNEEISEDRVILCNGYFKKYLQNKNYENILDAQILINSLHFGSLNDYIISKLIKEYVRDSKNIFVLDTTLGILKEKFLKLYPDVNFTFLSDIILNELENKLTYEDFEKTSYYVTDYKKGFIDSCKSLFGNGEYKIKKIGYY